MLPSFRSEPIRLFLVLDVLLDHLFVQPYGAHIVPTCPKSSILSGSPPPFRMSIIQHQGTFPFQIPHDSRHRFFRRYSHAQVDVILADRPFHYLNLLHLQQLPQDPFQLLATFPVQHLPPILRDPHDVVGAIPARVC